MATLAENVQKVKDAFAKIKTALTGKGVTVPSDARLSDVPALVDGISTGTPALCTFEITNSDGTKAVETTSEGVVELLYRCYWRLLATSISVEADDSAVFGTDASHMFDSCESLASLTLPAGFGAKITNASYMFSGCSFLASLELPAGFGASVTNAQSMFSSCNSLTSLTLRDGFGASVTNARSMFDGCYSLTSLTLPAGFGAKITDASYMFSSCYSLASLELPAGFGAKITNAQSMFFTSYPLASLTLPAGFGASVTNAQSMFDGCTSLTQILAPEGVTLADDGSNGILRMKVGFDLSSTALDKDSLIRVIKSLQTVTSKKLTLGATLLAKLEGDDNADGAAALALAAKKGWTIA